VGTTHIHHAPCSNGPIVTTLKAFHATILFNERTGASPPGAHGDADLLAVERIHDGLR
jgi:hypothetical protein